MVVTDVGDCSSVGANILKEGGNAIDAAVSCALCLGVLSPSSSGLGGGAFILYHDENTGNTRFLDSRETAPAAARDVDERDEPAPFLSDKDVVQIFRTKVEKKRQFQAAGQGWVDKAKHNNRQQ